MEIKEFYTLKTLEEVLSLLSLAPERSRVVAGGTDLLPQLRRGEIRADFLIDLTRVNELKFMAEDEESVRIGAGTTVQELAEDGLIRKHFRVLAEAAASLGSLQVRNRGTIGGNLGRSSPAADPVCALVALNATLVLKSREGQRDVLVRDFLVGPGRNVARPDEIIAEILIRKPQGPCGSKFLKLGGRKALVLAIVSAGAYLEVGRGGEVAQCGIGLGSVGPRTIWPAGVPELLLGRVLDRERLEAVVQKVSEAVSPISDVRGSAEYRRAMVPVLTRRALMAAASEAGIEVS